MTKVTMIVFGSPSFSMIVLMRLRTTMDPIPLALSSKPDEIECNSLISTSAINRKAELPISVFDPSSSVR